MFKWIPLLALLLLALPAEAASLDLRSDVDNASTLQTLSVDRSNVTFNSALGASGTAVVVWRAKISGNPSGASFTIKRSVLGGTAPDAVIAGARLYAEDGAGAVPFTPNSKFASGVALSEISMTEDNLGTAVGNGVCRFKLRLAVNTQSPAGAGTINTTLLIVGALNP